MRPFESLGSLAIYTSTIHQIFNRYDNTNPSSPNKQCYFTPPWMIPPWMFRRSPGIDVPTAYRLKKHDGTPVFTLNDDDIQYDQYLINGITYDYFCYKQQAIKSLGGNIVSLPPNEYYYLEIELGNNNFYYSEIFFVPSDCANDTVLHDLELVLNGDFSEGSAPGGQFIVPGWIRQNSVVAWSSGQITMSDNTQSGNMFRKTLAIAPGQFEWFKVCVEITAISALPGGTVRVTTSDGVYVFPNTPGTYCFYTTNPDILQFSSAQATWTINSVSVHKVKGAACLAHVKYWGDCFDSEDQTTSSPGKKFEMPFGDFDYQGILFLKSADDDPITGISRPAYEEEQESDKNGDLESFESFDKQWKTDNYFHALTIEPVLDELKKIQSYDRVTFYDPLLDQFWDKNEETDEITTDASWSSNTFASQVIIHMREGLIIKTGCCEDFSTVDCADCDPVSEEVLLHWPEAVSPICDEGLIVISDVDYEGNIFIGMSVGLSGWTPAGINGAGVIVDVSGEPGNWTITIDPTDECETAPSPGEVVLTVVTIPDGCTNTANIEDLQVEGYFLVIGESVGPVVQLQYAVFVPGNDCSDYTWINYGSTVSKDEYETVGILFKMPPGTDEYCVRVISSSPVSECIYDNSVCNCQTDE